MFYWMETDKKQDIDKDNMAYQKCSQEMQSKERSRVCWSMGGCLQVLAGLGKMEGKELWR